LLLENRTAVITGGASGMGRATALKFAGEGCDVAVVDMQLEGAQKVADQIKAMGRRAVAIKTDISSSADVSAMAARAIKDLGKIDILCNFAGGTAGVKGGDIETANEQDWDKVININLKGTFLVLKAIIPFMKEKKYGKIVNCASMGAVHPSVSVLHYHAAKAGVIGLTLNLAFELAKYNIYVNCIVPGPIETPFWDPLNKSMGEKARKEMFDALAKKEVPLGRMGTAEDIAGPALFLSCDLSSYVTGQILYVAGGQPGSSPESTFLSSSDRQAKK
jgi:NAD(P)-dependent dehydrogenase (short-subunit alcohol dehydrogenase family)